MNGSRWFSRLLFWSAHALALGSLVLLAVTPWLYFDEAGGGWPRVLALFGRDSVLRRTTLASALGLVVTAQIFFRVSPAAAGVGSAAAESQEAVGGRRRVRLDI